MADHGVDSPVLRVLQLIKDGPIERLPHAEHAAFAGTNNRTVTSDLFLNRLICSIHAHPLPHRLVSESSIPAAQSTDRYPAPNHDVAAETSQDLEGEQSEGCGGTHWAPLLSTKAQTVAIG